MLMESFGLLAVYNVGSGFMMMNFPDEFSLIRLKRCYCSLHGSQTKLFNLDAIKLWKINRMCSYYLNRLFD